MTQTPNKRARSTEELQALADQGAAELGEATAEEVILARVAQAILTLRFDST